MPEVSDAAPAPEILSVPPVRSDVVAFTMSAENVPLTDWPPFTVRFPPIFALSVVFSVAI